MTDAVPNVAALAAELGLGVAPRPIALAATAAAIAELAVTAGAPAVLGVLAATDEALVDPQRLGELGWRGEQLARVATVVDERLGAMGLARPERIRRLCAGRPALSPDDADPVHEATVATRDHELPSRATLALVARAHPGCRVVVRVASARLARPIEHELAQRARDLGITSVAVPVRPPTDVTFYPHSSGAHEASWAAEVAAAEVEAGQTVEVVIPREGPLGALVAAELARLGVPVHDVRTRRVRETALGRLLSDVATLAVLGRVPGNPLRERRLAALGVPRAAEQLGPWIEEARLALEAEELVLEPNEDGIARAIHDSLEALLSAGITDLVDAARTIGEVVLPPPDGPAAGPLRLVDAPTPDFAGHRLVLGATDANLPGATADNPAAPADLLGRLDPSLGVGAAGLAAWHRGALLLVDAHRVSVSAARTVAGEQLAPSPLIEELGIPSRRPSSPYRAEPTGWARRGARIARVRAHGTPSRFTWHPDGLALPERLSVTALDDAASCGARFALGAMLGVREREPQRRGVPARILGTLAHAALEHAATEPKTAELEHLLRESAARLDPTDRELVARDPLWEVRVTDLAKVLERVLADPELAPRGEVFAEVPFECDLGGVRISARFDRLERHGTAWRILDYKLRASRPPSWPIGTVRRPVQLAAYRVLAHLGSSTTAGLGIPPTSVEVAWVLLRARSQRVVAPRLGPLEADQEMLEALLQRLRSGHLGLETTGHREPCRLCRAEIACGILALEEQAP